MKIANIMNFVRQIDERFENSTEKLLEFTAEQLRLINEYSLDNTFLLQYDALCDDNFTELFKREATERTELGLWYEIVEPLASACGIPYNSENGWKWDFGSHPKYANGTEINYTVTEDTVLLYTTVVDGYNVTNSHTPVMVTVEGTKTWADANNQDGKRPESGTIRLRANGDE